MILDCANVWNVDLHVRYDTMQQLSSIVFLIGDGLIITFPLNLPIFQVWDRYILNFAINFFI